MTTLRFERRTVFAAIEVIDMCLSQAQFSRFVLELGQLPIKVRGEEVSVKKRANDLMSVVDKFPDHPLDGGILLRNAIVEKAVALTPAPRAPSEWETEVTVNPTVGTFLRTLEMDGYRITETGLQKTLPSEFGIPEAENELMALLGKHALSVAQGHLNQALDAHARGQWASANAMLRSFFDALLDELAIRIDPSASNLGSGQPRRTKLASAGFFIRDLNEWDDDGRGFINGLAKRLHPQGSHPGLSDEEDSAFRIHVVLLTARLLLSRFDRRPPA